LSLSDDELLQVLDNEIGLAKELIHNIVASERAYAYDLYYRKPLGNEVEGRSQVVTADVAMSIDTTLPALMEMFVASDRAVEFTPRKAEDVLGSEQATDLGNYVFYSQNRGYQLVYDVLWDGLVQKTGAFKWRWEKSTQVVQEDYMGLNDQQFVMLQQDPEVEIVAYSQFPVQMPSGDQALMHSVSVKKKKESGQVKITSIPVDELLLSPKARGYDLYDGPFVAHAPLLTRSELLELGVEAKVLDEIGEGDDDLEASEPMLNRNERLGIVTRDDNSPDLSQRRYRYYECYLNVDFDGDGIAELRRVCKVGSTIVHNDPTEHIPMSYWTPKTMPHEPIGQSMADDTADIQLLNTTLWRQALDALYLTTAPRTIVDVEANSGLPTLDDVLTVRPGGVIRARQGTVTPYLQQFDLAAISNMIEFNRQEGEQRTGAFRYGEGLDPNAVNKTATVANLQSSSTQARRKIYARNFAEQALIPLFKGIMFLLSQNQTEALTIRLRNEFVPIDPRVWSTEYDMSVNVGLGTGTKEQQFGVLSQLEMAQSAIAQSPYARLITEKNVFNLQKKKVDLAGYKDPEQFFSDPDKLGPPEPPPPPPEIQKAQMQIQADQEKQQAEMQMEGQQMQQEHQMKQQEMLMEMALKKMEMMMEAQLEKMKIELQAGVQERVGMANAAANAQRPQINPQ
jgi:hypothetical protein